jgi:DNA-binding NtrC family response regulator
VITDLRMPDMNGVALTAAIKAVAPLCPVILMTGNLTPEIHQRALVVGVDHFLPKPFPFDQLAAMVRGAGALTRCRRPRPSPIRKAYGMS